MASALKAVRGEAASGTRALARKGRKGRKRGCKSECEWGRARAGAPWAVGVTGRRSFRIDDNKGKLRQGRTNARGAFDQRGMAGDWRASTRNFTAVGAARAQFGSLFEDIVERRAPDRNL
ncbi:MAG: hypothetical protein BGP02_07450 [Pandoraea sp. 64-18]|nr:MAG: hypothetical protein BGP02_07450 [Pandoraea sp. 64-18]